MLLPSDPTTVQSLAYRQMGETAVGLASACEAFGRGMRSLAESTHGTVAASLARLAGCTCTDPPTWDITPFNGRRAYLVEHEPDCPLA